MAVDVKEELIDFSCDGKGGAVTNNDDVDNDDDDNDDDDDFEDEVDEDYFEETGSPSNDPVIQITVAGKEQNRLADGEAEVDVPVDDADDDADADVDVDADEDDEADEHLFTDDELSESPSERKRPKRKIAKSVEYNETERPKRKRPKRDGPPRKRIIVKKPVNCPECDKQLCDSSSLKLHMVSLKHLF